MSVPTMTPRAAREQSTFRALLSAMARPGSIASLGADDDRTDAGAAVTILESLLDHEVTFAVVPERADTIDAILRQTGSHNVKLADADYVLTGDESLAHVLGEVKIGNLEYPDRSATVVCRVGGLGTGAGHNVLLEGPGIESEIQLSLEGLDATAIAAIQETNGSPPLGVDIVFVAADGRFACLTRYTKLREVSQ